MSFDIAAFARTNKVVLIWAAFAALIYLFRDMFGLVFITYVMCFVTFSITRPLERRLKGGRRVLVTLLYLVFLVFIGGFLFFLTPRLLDETKSFTEQLPAAMDVIDAWVDQNAEAHSVLPEMVRQAREYLTPEQMIIKGWSMGRSFLEAGAQYVSWFFLGLMFSFLIMLDLPRMETIVRNLRKTRLADVYDETADSVVLFAKVVGESFRAQILTSAVDTVLMAIGLVALGINGVVLLCTLVFLCGLIPVLGVILSSVPIVLMAVNSGGISLGLWALGLIIVISLIEAYVINPRIVSSVMSINPVITLIILYIGYTFFGLWGMVLGAPVAVYIYRQILTEKTFGKKRGGSGKSPGA